ncbi:MAG: T9SS type A sorting domain-containing protein [Bacteroidia bacterium]
MKSLILFMCLLFTVNCSYSQMPSYQWAKSAGGLDYELGFSITADANGNSYVTGYFGSPSIIFGSFTLNNNGGNDIFIIKYDPAGNVIWAKSAGGVDYDFGKSIATDALDNIYVTGIFNSPSITFGAFTINNNAAGSNDIFIVKYDTAGNVIWAKSVGGISDDSGISITTDAIGNSYVTGNFQSPSIIFGAFTLNNIGNGDVFIVKYDTAGNVIWAKSAGGTDYELAYSIAADANGNSYITGYFQSQSITFGPYTLNSNGNADVFIVKYDTAGNVIWANSAGGTNYEMGYSITTDANANSYVTGYFEGPGISFGSDTLNTNGFSDVFIVKYDTDGNVIWATSAGGTDYDIGYSITTDANDNSYVTGIFYVSITFGSFTLNSNANGTNDIFLVKYDSTGNVIWAQSAGGTGYGVGHSITTDTYGNIYITGGFSSPEITFGSDTLTNNGSGDDIFITKLSACYSTNSTLNLTTCNTYTSPSGNYTWTNSGTYTDTIPNSNGCDSVITINLTINNSTASTLNATACISYTSPSGNYTWTNSGIYFDTIPGSNGCDSIITLNITINTVDTNITVNGDTLFANAVPAIYQWLNCDSNMMPITGAAGQSFIPVATGSYAVAVTQNNCTDTSFCYSITVTGINENTYGSNLDIYPNPCNGVFSISTAELNYSTTMYDILGNIIYEGKNEKTINLAAQPKGIYFIKVITPSTNAKNLGEVYSQKIIIQ